MKILNKTRNNAGTRSWQLLLSAWLILAMSINTGWSAEQSALSVGPSRIQVSLLQGQEYRESLRVENDSRFPMRITVKPWNFAYDRTGQIHPIPEKMAQKFRGCAKWLKPVKSLVAQPHSEVKVPISVRVPTHASVGTHCAHIRVIGIPVHQDRDRSASRARIRCRLNALLLVVVQSPGGLPRLRAGAKLRSFRPIKYFNFAAPVVLTTCIRNIGNSHLNLSGQVKITGQDGRVEAVIPIRGRTLLPERQSVITCNWDRMPLFGKFQAQLVGQCAISDISQHFESESAQFWVISAYLILLVAVLMVAIASLTAFLLRKTRFAVQGKEILVSLGRKSKAMWQGVRRRAGKGGRE